MVYKKLNKENITTIGLLILLVILIVMIYNITNKKENFTDKERKAALDGLTLQNKLFNSVFSKVDNNNVEINKNLITNKYLTAKTGATINGNLLVPGKDIKNNKITIGANGTIYVKRINIDGFEFGINEAKQLMGGMNNIAGWVIDGGGSTHILSNTFNRWRNTSAGDLYDAWSNDTWDILYVNRGWKIELSEHSNGKGKIGTYTNPNWNQPAKYDLNNGVGRNKASSVKITWIGY